MMILVCRWFIYFIIYSFLGWVMEVIQGFIKEKRFINRGFLIGPVCPIYGFGVFFIVLLIDGKKSDILSVFLKSILICSILEYFTSLFMEKLFHARWWDYSNRRFNINGRICLETMIPFGILGSLIVLVFHPIIENFISIFSNGFISIVGISLMTLLIIDVCISLNVLSKIKKEIKNYSKDSTEIIRNKVTKWLKDNTYLFKHIFNAFPRFSIISKVKEKVLK